CLPAAAGDDGGVAVVPPRATIGVPDRLRIEMGMMIDEARRHDAPLGIDRPLGGSTGIFADPDNLAVLHRNIGGKCRLARAVDNAPVSDEQIIRHSSSSSLPPAPSERSGLSRRAAIALSSPANTPSRGAPRAYPPAPRE